MRRICADKTLEAGRSQALFLAQLHKLGPTRIREALPDKDYVTKPNQPVTPIIGSRTDEIRRANMLLPMDAGVEQHPRAIERPGGRNETRKRKGINSTLIVRE